MIGHSDGGPYAMLLAETAALRPAGLAMVEPPDERSLSPTGTSRSSCAYRADLPSRSSRKLSRNS